MITSNKNNEKTKKAKKKSTKIELFKQHFMVIVIILLSALLVLLIINQIEVYQLSRSMNQLALSNQKIQEESLWLKNKLDQQNAKLDEVSQQFNTYSEERITKDQYTEIYMQLQELTGMISAEKKREFYINRIVRIISQNNKKLKSETIYQISKNIYEIALKYNFNPLLVCALIKVESNFNIKSVSDSYAYGLCQVRRFIAKELAENIGLKWDGTEKTLFNPEKNIMIGIHYLSLLNDDFDDLKIALTAYNHGPFKIQELLSEKKALPNGYMNKVISYYSDFRGFNIDDIDEILEQEKSS